MLIIGLNGSPKKGGSTAYLINTALDLARAQGASAELIEVAPLMELQTNPFCTACASPCPGTCYRDSDLESAYHLLCRADGIIIGSPVYFGTVSAQLKAFWDKTRKLRTEKSLLDTVGAAVTTGASRFGGQETTIKALYDMMMVQGMILVGDGHSSGDAGHHGTCAQAPARDDNNAFRRLELLTLRLLEVARSTSSLRRSID